MTVQVNVERKAVEVTWDADAADVDTVTLYAQGADNDWHNTVEMPNDGRAALSYPAGFTGSSKVEVRDGDGNVVDEGEIEVG